MKTLKASTKTGQSILRKADYNEGYYLSEVYSSYSWEKEKAWLWCKQQYLMSDNHTNFHICSHNTFGFTVAWFCTINDEKCLRLETKDNSYLIWLDR